MHYYYDKLKLKRTYYGRTERLNRFRITSSVSGLQVPYQKFQGNCLAKEYIPLASPILDNWAGAKSESTREPIPEANTTIKPSNIKKPVKNDIEAQIFSKSSIFARPCAWSCVY